MLFTRVRSNAPQLFRSAGDAAFDVHPYLIVISDMHL